MGFQGFAEAFHAGFENAPNAVQSPSALIVDHMQPALGPPRSPTSHLMLKQLPRLRFVLESPTIRRWCDGPPLARFQTLIQSQADLFCLHYSMILCGPFESRLPKCLPACPQTGLLLLLRHRFTAP
jgi:hypothetical protein